ncbi:lasso RiPP family leader peptide-containing protein [Salinadaptatus halalkaliphilus]|uniref:Lasso RiPP family leader peptide-containing protein n=1 Tax=Salinadaptatus halalkaliphilus TaxID=2419781 RepID=A0A4S3TLS8_9EURY|nr:lasso RiPP family leader peptide-containing protein [Salinadaptatus halalkaliphilus]THE65151.1 lasso RiPP family leader peptide-containing protein [Salinadaptatus halalkaliphilus]
MSEYEIPAIVELGAVEELTEGQHFSRVDGNSGTTGNRGHRRGT